MLISPIRRVLALVLAICLLSFGLAGCSDDDNSFVDTSTQDVGTITYQTVLAKAVPGIVTTYRFTGRDGNNAIVFGPASTAKAPSITLIVPRTLIHLMVEYLDAQNNVIGIVNVDVNLSGGSATVTDPDFSSPGGEPTQVSFNVQPSNIGPGGTISPAVTVEIEDENGGTVTTANDAVTIALGANPGNATLGGTLTVNAVNGVATFSDLTLDNVGTGYTLVASSGTLEGDTSSAFSVLQPGNPAQLLFTGTISDAQANTVLSGVTVEVRDNNNILVPTASNDVTIQIDNNAGGGTLSGTVTVAAVNGVANFTNLSISAAGNGYTLSAESNNLTPDTSNAFNITPDSNPGLTLDFGTPLALTLNGGTGGGANAQQTAVGDVNNDGNLDFVTANSSDNSISVYPGNGNGTFGSEVVKATLSGPLAVTVGEFTGDSNNDIVVATATAVCLFPGDGTLNFNTRNDFTNVATSARGMCALNLDGDNDLDLALADFGNDSVRVLVNTGAGSFNVETYTSNNTLEQARSIVSGDFNGDSFPDLAIASFSQGQGPYIWLNTGTGGNSFPVANLATNLAASSGTGASQTVSVGDVDNDGDTDVVSSFTDGAAAAVVPYLNNGSGVFTAGASVNVSGDPFGSAMADFNDDGRDDFASGSAFGLNNNGTGELDVLLGNANGSLSAQVVFPANTNDTVRSLAVGDFNEDGLPDVVATGAADVNVFLNTSN